MDYDRLLLSKAAQTGRIETLLLSGIREEHFYDQDLKDIYIFLVEHYKKYKSPPSFSIVKEEFPFHNFEIIDESIDFLKDKFINQTKWRFATDSVRDLAGFLNAGPDGCENIEGMFLERSRTLASLVPSATMGRLSDLNKRLIEYETPLNGNQGIKMGIPAFDNICLGIQPHEYITIMGKTGVGKSALAQYVLLEAYKQNKTSMYVSFEMDKRSLFRRWDTMLIKELGYHDLKSHQLNEEQRKALHEKAKELKGIDADILVFDDVRNFNVDRVYAEMVRHTPDICCIDYITQMNSSNKDGASWEKIANTTRELKQTVLTLKTPIIGIAQINRSGFDEGPEINNVAGSINIMQDSDIVFGLFQSIDMKKESRMQIRMLKNRDGIIANADMKWDMETMTIEPWNGFH